MTSTAETTDELATALEEIGAVASTNPNALPAARMRDLLERVLADLAELLAIRFDREECAELVTAAVADDPLIAGSTAALREQHRVLAGRVAALRRQVPRHEITALQREVLALVQALQIHEHGELGLLQPGIAEPLDERH